MLVIFGHRTKASVGKMLNQSLCESCNQGQLRVFSLFSYVHVFWIPFFPYRRQVATECSHCQHVAVGKQVAQSVQEAIKREGSAPAMPKYMFTGLALIAVFAVGSAFNSRATAKRSSDYVTAPQINDHYVVDYEQVLGVNDPDTQYGVLKVTGVEDDSLRVQIGTYAYEYHTDAARAVSKGSVNEAEYFLEDELVLARSEVVDYHTKKWLKRVIR